MKQYRRAPQILLLVTITLLVTVIMFAGCGDDDALVLPIPSGEVQWITNGVSISNSTGSQQAAQITSDGAGGAIITWQDYRSAPEWDIYAQRVDSTGAVQWITNGVAISTAYITQDKPQITSDGAGGAIITWSDARSVAWYAIYAQRVNSTGTVQWIVDGVSISNATGNQDVPQITSDGAGGAIITWQDPRDGNLDIYAQGVDSTGAVQWTVDGVAISNATGNQQTAQITSDGAGGAIITWADYRDGNADIYAQRVDSTGTVQWITNGVAISNATGNQQAPQITSDGSDGAIITWQDDRDGFWDIYAQRVDSTGTAQWITNGVAVSTAYIGQDIPQITSDGAGGAIITWQDDREVSWYAIYAQRINSSGAAEWTADGVVISNATGNQDIPQITADGSGGAIITWEDPRDGPLDIYAQRVDSGGAVQWTANGVVISNSTGNQQTAQITTDGSSGAIITWADYRDGNADIYAQGIK